jgi:hypothetical protein
MAEIAVIVLREIQVQSVVGFAFAGEDASIRRQGLLENGDFVGGPEEVAVAVRDGSYPCARKRYDSSGHSQ